MPRPRFPHTLRDVTHALDGVFGLVVGDLDDGRLWVLQRERKTGAYRLTCWADAARSRALEERRIDSREAAIAAFAACIGLSEGGSGGGTG